MAIVKCIASGCPMNNIFPYVMNRNKTEDGILVSGIHCTPESAFDECREAISLPKGNHLLLFS